jgi:hypothetical protein
MILFFMEFGRLVLAAYPAVQDTAKSHEAVLVRPFGLALLHVRRSECAFVVGVYVDEVFSVSGRT